ncbi:MAG: hypothetical protein KatS3mg104_2940 [Phycisphaerae bacterium]|nr:MAG: hypothetical protein KatS3mg104_2940 [Phycisphaerae bacterium]
MKHLKVEYKEIYKYKKVLYGSNFKSIDFEIAVGEYKFPEVMFFSNYQDLVIVKEIGEKCT